jgi:Prenyltransferase and squalene oxidase repeat
MARFWVALLLIAQTGCVQTEQPPLARAAAYLWSRQAEDGGWHSQTYGLLRSGQSMTPFVLAALLEVPAGVCPLPQAKLDRALAFLRSHTRADGALGLADDIPDYPNYATALAVMALAGARRPGWEAQIKPMVEYLRSQQFVEQNGWRGEDPAYGAWGMGGERRPPPDTGHVDLSMTRHVIEALRAIGVAPADPALQRAQVFITRCQNPDGGFFFTTTEFDTNKAGHDGKQFRSYGTATADGIVALLATGWPREDARVVSAARWLKQHHRGMDVPGFVGPAYDRWPRGLAFYYSAASTEAFRALRMNPGTQIVDGLRRAQRTDGSWSNPESLVKEDDPLIATAFAVRALSLPALE